MHRRRLRWSLRVAGTRRGKGTAGKEGKEVKKRTDDVKSPRVAAINK